MYADTGYPKKALNKKRNNWRDEYIMVDANQLMYDVIRKSNTFETTYINEIEEVVDTGLEKTEDNIQKIALEYLDEKGFARRIDNLERAKQHIIESSMYSDTVCVRKRREICEDMLSDCEEEEIEKYLRACTLDKLNQIAHSLAENSSIVRPRYEYTLQVINDIYTMADKGPSSVLSEYETFDMLLNRYAAAGWRMKNIIPQEVSNHKISMSGFTSTQKRMVVIFERLK